MSKIAYLNSKFIRFKDAKIHIEDRGLQFSDSVYEVVAFYNKELIDFNFHFKRLKFSLKELDIKFDIKKKNIKKIFNKLIILNKFKNGIIYLQITRGVQARDHLYNNSIIPNLIIYSRKKIFNLPNNKFNGKTAITFPDLRWKRRDIKTTSLLANILAKKAANKKKAYEAILIDNNKVTEATSSNVWIVKNKKLITHPSNSDILKGITRNKIKTLILKNRLILKETFFSKKQLFSADAVFITSATGFVTPIIKIDSIKINKGKIGPLSKKLASLYFETLNND